MQAAEVYEKITPIFRTIFQEPDLVIKPEMAAADVARWDSLTHTEMISAVEKAFGLNFGFREVAKWKNVGDMVNTILAKVN